MYNHNLFYIVDDNSIQQIMIPRLTTEQFIKQARAKYGDRYAYDKTNYKNMKTLVTITCPAHGDVIVNPFSFLRIAKHGCGKCGDEVSASIKTISKDEMLAMFRDRHGDEYNYSQVDYLGTQQKIKIKHNVCGRVFYQVASSHLKHGCKYCSWKRRGKETIKKSKAGFLARAIKIHGDAYDYDLSDFDGIGSKVSITCKLHGNKFKQSANNHLHPKRPTGCPICARERLSAALALGADKFVEQARVTHGFMYDYSEVDYKNNRTKVKIICPEHGPFYQVPWSHLSGNGCPNCSGSRMERKIHDFLRSKKIRHRREFSFPDCVHIGRLKFDFAIIGQDGIPVGLIEYHGDQHFKVVEHFGGLEGFEQRVLRDKIKQEYCARKSLPLLVLTSANDNNCNDMVYKFVRTLIK